MRVLAGVCVRWARAGNLVAQVRPPPRTPFSSLRFPTAFTACDLNPTLPRPFTRPNVTPHHLAEATLHLVLRLRGGMMDVTSGRVDYESFQQLLAQCTCTLAGPDEFAGLDGASRASS